MPSKITYFDNITDSFQDSSLQSINPDFEVLHYEDIPDKNLYGRQPFRLNAFVAGLITGGTAVLTINSKDYHLERGALYFSTPWHIRKYSHIHKWEGYMLFFTQQYLYQYSMGNAVSNEFPFFQSENGVVVSTNENELVNLRRLFDEMYGLFKSDKINRYKAIFHYINIFLLECTSVKNIEISSSTTSSENIVNLFQEQLNNYFVALNKNIPQETLSLTNIANQLHLHPIYLSNLVKEKCGKTVSQIIRERMVLEAKALLKNSMMTVSEIAYYLQFSDTSNFAKFFKSLTGTSPSSFRSSPIRS